MLSLQSNHFLKKILIYCSVILALSIITQTICLGLKTEESESLKQNGDIPIFAPDEATNVPKKESADTRSKTGKGISAQGKGFGRQSIFDVYKCNFRNRRRCRRKLKSLDLYYCHCYQDKFGQILRCGYRGKGGRCKTPEFN